MKKIKNMSKLKTYNKQICETCNIPMKLIMPNISSQFQNPNTNFNHAEPNERKKKVSSDYD